MNIQKTSPNFGARVKLKNVQKNLKELGNASAECSVNNMPSTTIGGAISSTTGVKVSGGASVLMGSGSVAEAAGTNSSNLFPSAVNIAQTSLNESSVGTIKESPSFFGFFMSVIGGLLSQARATIKLPNGGKININ